MVAATRGVQTGDRERAMTTYALLHSLGPGQTQLPKFQRNEVEYGVKAHLTRTPFSLTIWFESARVNATMAPLVEV